MLNVSFSATFISKGSGLRSDESGKQVKYYFVNLASADGVIDRISIQEPVFRELEDSSLTMGDSVAVSAELRQVSAERKWFLRPTIILKE